jgi:two-component system sensor histidine kinase AlgZ
MKFNRSLKKQRDIYKIVSIPLYVVLVMTLHVTGLNWLDSAALGFSIGAFGQLITEPSKYSARITPIGTTPVWRLFIVHLTTSQILSALWLLAAILLSHALVYIPSLRGIDARFVPREPVIYAAGSVLYLLSIAYHYAATAIDASREAETRAMTVSIQAREAELKALKSQINPHFLFNSLNSISALTGIDPMRARDMCVLLGDFLRMTLGLGEKTAIRLSEELDLLEKYLAIEKVRFGERLKMHQEIQPETRDCLLPPLLLQPLLENSIKHGIASLIEGGEVRIVAHRVDGRLDITVENSWDPDSPPSRKGGLGLRNVQQRLDARYGKFASFRISDEGDLFQVQMSIPAEREETV